MFNLAHRAWKSSIAFTAILKEIVRQALTGETRILTKSAATFWGDRSATMQHVEFYNDPLFVASKNYTFSDAPAGLVASIQATNIDWRLHICTWAASRCIHLEGDFVECGVWYGWLSRAMCKYVDFGKTDKQFHFFDSWGTSDSHEMYLADIFDAVKSRFKSYPNVVFHRGMVPRVLEESAPIKKIAYLSLDMNGGVAERQALEVLYDKVVSGGIIYIDDFGWNYPRLRSELAAFLADKPEKLLHFPCGSSILVKL